MHLLLVDEIIIVLKMSHVDWIDPAHFTPLQLTDIQLVIN
jgi:hypothetical protein